MKKTQRLLANDPDWSISVNEHRVLVQQRRRRTEANDSSTSWWSVLSHAVLNGGQVKHAGAHHQMLLKVLNARVPVDYDGIHPDPKELLRRMAAAATEEEEEEEGRQPPKSSTTTTTTTIGLLTAASMESLRIASQEATDRQGTRVVVDAIVTAGISNARAAGAKADCFDFCVSESSPPSPAKEEEHTTTTTVDSKYGTINTIVIINAPLDTTTLVEAYAVAIEAKCRALHELGIVCQSNCCDTATGTGTDCTVLLCRSGTTSGGMSTNIAYAGKHTILGELIGRAVKDATLQAVESNIRHLYGSWWWLDPLFCYHWHCRFHQVQQAVVRGHRPIVPSNPMQLVPRPTAIVAGIGMLGIVFAFWVHVRMMPMKAPEEPRESSCQTNWQLLATSLLLRPSCSVLFAVLMGDRYLGSIMMPLAVHPVVLVGSLITFLVGRLPESSFDLGRPLLGFASGAFVFFTTIVLSISIAATVLALPLMLRLLLLPMMFDNQTGEEAATCHFSSANSIESGWLYVFHYGLVALAWLLQVFLVRGSLSLQLLCNIALQMADLLERLQLTAARNQLSWLCSRDPSTLRVDELAGSTLESLAENLSDSVTSPLFFYVLAGPLGAFAFRVSNTLDSRLGFRDHREYVGKLSARWDDVLNLIPARLTAVVLAMTASVTQLWNTTKDHLATSLQQRESCKVQSLRGLRVAWRDSSQCDSPNAGWPMATMAGLLDVRLEKRAHYSLNRRGAAPTHYDIRRGHYIAEMSGVSLFALAAVAILVVDGSV